MCNDDTHANHIIFIIMNYSFNESWPAHIKGRHFKRHVVLFERSFSTVFSIRFSPNYFLSFTEAFVRRCSVKKVFLNSSPYSQENIYVGAYFLIKLLKVCNCIKKRLQRSWFHVNIEKFLGTPILKNICERLLLQIIHWKLMLSFHISWTHQKNVWLSDIFTVREKIQIPNFFWSEFSCIIRTRKNYVLGHFSCSRMYRKIILAWNS